MRKLTPTEKALIAQLTENTGMAMCDSGGAYGRNWEKNQGRTFIDEPATVLKFERWGDCFSINVTHNVFHWLNERVDYDADMTRKLKVFARRKQYEDSYWLIIMEDFAAKHGAHEDSIGMVNTYNGEDLLSQVLQYYHWYDRDAYAEYAAIQIHGGCDVRGGYTAPKIYRVCDGLFDNARARIHCPVCRAMWESDEGYYWQPYEGYIDLSFLDAQKAEGNIALPLDIGDREAWPLLNLSEEGYSKKQVAYVPVKLDTEEFPPQAERVRGYIYINSAEDALCPYCLQGVLEGSW